MTNRMHKNMERLKAYVFDPEIIDPLEETDKMCLAVFNSNMEEIEEIIRTNGVNGKTIFDLTLLHLACKYEKLEIVKYLMENDADITNRDCNGRTPMFYTIHYERKENFDELCSFNDGLGDYKDNLGNYQHNGIYAELCLHNQGYREFDDKFGFQRRHWLFHLNTLRGSYTNKNSYVNSFLLFHSFLSNLKQENRDGFDDYELYMFAIQTNDRQFKDDVMDYFIDLNSFDQNGYTIFHKMFMNNEIILRDDHNININAITRDEGLSLIKIGVKNQLPLQLFEILFNEDLFYSSPVDHLKRTDLQFAILSNQFEYFDYLIQRRPQFQSTDVAGNTCLHFVVIHTPDIDYTSENWESSYMIKILKLCNHNLIYVKNIEGKTAFDLAIMKEKTNMAVLLKELVDEDAPFASIEHYKRENKAEEVIKEYINDDSDADDEYISDRQDSFSKDDYCDNNIREIFHDYFITPIPLKFALSKVTNNVHPLLMTIYAKSENIQELINDGKYKRDKNFRIPLHFAVSSKDPNVSLGRILYEETPKDCLKRDGFGNTSFAFARIHNMDIYSDICNKVEGLFEKATIYVLKRESENLFREHQTFIQFPPSLTCASIKSLMVRICEYNNDTLIQLYAKLSVHLRTNSTLLQLAVQIYNYGYRDGWIKLVRQLIETGQDIHCVTDDGKTLLHLASEHTMDESIIRFLLAYGVNINAIDKNGQTAIHILIETHNDIHYLDMPYSIANTEIVDSVGANYLHYFATFSLDEPVFNNNKIFTSQFLTKNNDGKTPLHIAGELGNVNIFENLLPLCSCEIIFQRDNFGYTAIDYAFENEHYSIIWLFIRECGTKIEMRFNELFVNFSKERQYWGIISKKKFRKLLAVEDDTNYITKNWAKIFQELSVCRISLVPEFEFEIQCDILDSDLTVVKNCDIPNKSMNHQKHIEEIQSKVTFLIKLINETASKLVQMDINHELYQSIIEIAIIIRQLKDKLKFYINLPWREMEFILVAFISVCSHQNESEKFVNIILLNKYRVAEHLIQFKKSLEEKRATISFELLFPNTFDEENLKRLNSETKSLQKLIDSITKTKNKKELNKIKTQIYKLKDLIDKSTPGSDEPHLDKCEQIKTKKMNEFKDLFDDYHATRTFFSLSKILRYINASVVVDIKSELEILVIQRTMQVFGEFIKNSVDTPNVSQKVHDHISSFNTKYLNDCLKNIRNDLSHANYMKSTLDIESNVELYTSIQTDLRHLRPLLINLMYEERTESVRKLLRKMFKSQTLEELNYLVSHITSDNEPECDLFLKVETLVQRLKDVIVVKTKIEENTFFKIESIIKNGGLSSSLGYNFSDPEKFLLNTVDKISLGQTKQFLQSGEAPIKCAEPFQLIGYFTLQLQKMTENRFHPKFKQIQQYCNEILWTSIKGVKIKIENKIKFGKKFRDEQIIEINKKLDDYIGRIQNLKLKFACESELTYFKDINKIYSRIKELVQKSKKTNEENEELDQVLDDYKKVFDRKKISHQFRTEIEYIKEKQKQEDKYFVLTEDSFNDKSVTLTSLTKFLNCFKCIEENRSNELRGCFIERIHTLKRLMPSNISKYFEDRKPDGLIIALEMIILNIYEILDELKMIDTNGDFLDEFLLPLSTISLRNHLAHGDALFELLPFKTDISVLANGQKLINFIEESKFDIFSEDNIIYYTRKSTQNSSYEERFQFKMDFIQLQNNVLNEAIQCNPLASLYYFYVINNLHGVDLKGKTFFNLLFDSNPIQTIKFFMRFNKSLIRCSNAIECLADLLDLTNTDSIHADFDSYCRYLVNKLFLVNEKNEINALLIKICTLKGYYSYVDEISANCKDDKVYEIFLKENYNSLLNLADQFSFVKHVQHYSRKNIPEYDHEFSVLHLAVAFNHTCVTKKLLSLHFPVNVTAKNRKTPLHVAAQCGHKNICKLLIKNGANKAAKTINGLTYIDFIEKSTSIASTTIRRCSL